MSRNKSFTLIELLVVIAVIGLISSVVLVSFNPAEKKQKARIAKSLSFSQSLQNVLGSETAGIWTFDGDSGVIAKDVSGFGNDGNIIGGGAFSNDTPHGVIEGGGGKQSHYFDGINDYIETSAKGVPTGNSPITYEAWIYPQDYGRYIVGPIYGDPIGFLIGFSPGQIGVRLFDTPITNQYYYSSNGLSLNFWHHVAVSYESNKLKFYIDGVLDKTTSVPAPRSAAINNIYIGRATAGVGYFFGKIDDVKIYAKALSAAEIQKHYAQGLEKIKLVQNNGF